MDKREGMGRLFCVPLWKLVLAIVSQSAFLPYPFIYEVRCFVRWGADDSKIYLGFQGAQIHVHWNYDEVAGNIGG